MTNEDRLYLQIVIGTLVGVLLGVVAFALVTTCTVGSLCTVVDAAEPQLVYDRNPRSVINADIVPQSVESDLDAIIVIRAPQPEEAIDRHVSNQKVARGATLPAEMALSEIQPSINLRLDSETMDGLIDATRSNITMQQSDWDAHHWMIITGGYQTLNAAELDAAGFEDVDYELLVFFRKNEFRTAIVGSDSAEAAYY